MHRQFHGIPRASAVATVGCGEMRVLAVSIVQRAAHGKAPQHFLPRRMVEHRVAIAELHRTMPLLVVKDRARDAPGVAIVAGDDGVDTAHVGLARDAFLISHDKVLLLPQGDGGLAKQRSARLLVGSADNAHVADIAGGWGVGDLVFSVKRSQRRQQQGGEECGGVFHLGWVAY